MLTDIRIYITMWLVWFIVCVLIVLYDTKSRTVGNRWMLVVVELFLATTVIIFFGALFMTIWG